MFYIWNRYQIFAKALLNLNLNVLLCKERMFGGYLVIVMAFTDEIVNVLVLYKGRLEAVNRRRVSNVGVGNSTQGQYEERMKLCNST